MKNLKAENVKIAYIGGGSRGWAWGLMSDLAMSDKMSGEVSLYDIDLEAAEHNAVIGNKYNTCEGAISHWDYKVAYTRREALKDADFVVISILPATFDEMESDVHTPEKYGIYQSVGDSTGPGGIIRAMRTVPMMEEIARDVRDICPDAWVINYTNPMTLSVRALYRAFPEIKAFGCCHEVFGTQKVLIEALKSICGIEGVKRSEIKVNPVGINHFTWLTDAKYRDLDLFPIYRKFAEKYAATGFTENLDPNWMNNSFKCSQRVKLDLFLKYGYIAAAGDRHLAEFCNGGDYLSSPEKVREWGFGLTTVAWRKKDLENRLRRSERLRTGEEEVKIKVTGEEGVNQMAALLGLSDLVTNVNIPNRGQIPNLPLGAVVETNAVFRSGSLVPVLAGEIPKEIFPLVSRVCYEQENVSEAIANRDLSAIFEAFASDPLVTCSKEDAKKLFDEMIENTRSYLKAYNI